MIGMGIGILIKNMLVALLVGIILGFLVEPIVSVVFFVKRWDQLLNLMPTRSDQRDAGDHLAGAVRGAPSDALVARRPDPGDMVPAAGDRWDAVSRTPRRCVVIWPTSLGASRVRLRGMARVVVDVMPKPEILDPQGKAVTGALARLGFAGMSVRQGKRFELELEGEVTEERLAEVRRAAETLLANTVIETFDVRVEPAPASAAEDNDAEDNERCRRQCCRREYGR